jgi:hypothetical protein
MWGREGVEVIVESEVVCRCFLGVFGGILAVKCHDSNGDLLDKVGPGSGMQIW